MTGRLRVSAMAVVFLAFGSFDSSAQSVLLRTPNVSGGWDGAPGTIYFNFLHRFQAGDAPSRQVINFPTFLLGTGIPGNILLAAHYATRSDLVAAYPNEWEFFARAMPLKQFSGFPLDVSIQGGYNLAAESFDGELTLARELGPLRLIAAGRAMSKGYGEDRKRFAVAGGGTLKLNRWFAVAGDASKLFESQDPLEETAWGAALQMAIPFTPHSFSLQVTNTNTATVQGSSRGRDERRYGFEFTVPITLSRYFGKRPAVADEAAAPEAAPQTDTTRTVARVDTTQVARDTMRQPVRDTARQPVRDTVRPPVRDTMRQPVRDTVRISTGVSRPPQTDTTRRQTPPAARPPTQQQQPAAQARTVTSRMRQLRFEPGRVAITAGSAVIWRNDDQVAHTVKAGDGSWESPLIQPGGSYRRTFARAGTFAITCGPHPFMKQTVEVK